MAQTSPTIDWVRCGFVIALATAAALLALAVTVEQTLCSRSPQQAIKWWGGSRCHSSLAAKTLLRAKTKADLTLALSSSRAALGRQPVNAVAAGTLGLALEGAGEPTQARRYLAYAERLSRRDLRVQLWHIEAQIQRNNIPGALVHYDRALRVSPESGELLYPILVKASEDPAIAQPLARLLSRRPNWWSSFLLRLVPDIQSAESLRLIVQMIRPDTRDLGERQLLSYAINRLVQLNDPSGAYRLYLAAVPKAQPAAMVRNGGFDAPNDLPPIDWAIAETASVEPRSDADQGNAGVSALRLGSNGGDSLRARQLLLLRPGTYRLTFIVGDVAAASGQPIVSIECTDTAGARSIGQVTVSEASSSERPLSLSFDVPASECPAQWLSIRAGPGTDAAGGPSPWIDEFAVSARG